jgi:hypothetical protein
MFQVLYPGRTVVLNSPLSVEEVTRRLQQGFAGTVTGGRLRVMRRVRGRNSFRPIIEGLVSPNSAGSRLDLRMRLHPFSLAAGAVFAFIAGTLAVVAAPPIPIVGSSPLLIRVLVLGAVALLFAALGNIEVRTSTRLLSELAEAKPHAAAQAAETVVAPLR